MKKNKIEIALIKHLEYFDGKKWCPIIWYSNRSDSEFESLFDGPDFVEHSNIFYNSFDEFSNIIEKSQLEKRGLPDDLSDYIKDKINKMPGSFYGASYYYLNELNELIEKEEGLLLSELKNGIEIKLFDDHDILKKLIGNDVEYKEEFETDGEKTINTIRTTAKTVKQLQYIANILSKFVYEIHGFIEDEKIRVIFFYKK